LRRRGGKRKEKMVSREIFVGCATRKIFVGFAIQSLSVTSNRNPESIVASLVHLTPPHAYRMS